MKRTLIAVAVLLLASCKGPQGDKGDRGPGTVTNLSGVVTSNSFYVFNQAITPNANVFVSIGDGLSFTELPYLLPAQGFNTYYLLSPGSVQIVNAQYAGATAYKITAVSAAPIYFGSKLLE